MPEADPLSPTPPTNPVDTLYASLRSQLTRSQQRELAALLSADSDADDSDDEAMTIIIAALAETVCHGQLLQPAALHCNGVCTTACMGPQE